MNDLIFVDANGMRHAHPAPEGFDWGNYPGVIVRDGYPYHYAGTTDGTPHYIDRYPGEEE